MANSKENYLRMLILFLPYLDCRFFHKNTFSQEELESLNEALGERTNEEALTSAIVSK